jgi:hypothetical protein
LGERLAGDLLARAEEAASGPIPALSATQWLQSARSGERDPYLRTRNLRWASLERLVLGECLEGWGAF